MVYDKIQKITTHVIGASQKKLLALAHEYSAVLQRLVAPQKGVSTKQVLHFALLALRCHKKKMTLLASLLVRTMFNKMYYYAPAALD